MNKILGLAICLFALTVVAQKVEFKVDNSQLPQPLTPPDFEIVNGQVEISGEPVNEKPKAYQSWKKACGEWEAKVRDNNKGPDDKVIGVDCGAPTVEQDKYLYTYTSTGTYKVRTRVRDKK